MWRTRKFHIRTSITQVLWDAYEKLSTINICTILKTPSKWSTLPKAAPKLSVVVHLAMIMDIANRTWRKTVFVSVMWVILEMTAQHQRLGITTWKTVTPSIPYRPGIQQLHRHHHLLPFRHPLHFHHRRHLHHHRHRHRQPRQGEDERLHQRPNQ